MTQGQNNESNETKTQGQTKSQGQKAQGQGAKAQGQKKPKAEKAPKVPKEPKPKKEKPVRETPAHMPKVDKVANQLPKLSDDAMTLFTAANNLSTADIVNLNAHLQIAVRRRGVATAAQLIQQGKSNPNRELKVGQRVQVVSGQNPRFIGQEGTVSKVQRIRCYVELDSRKDQYTEKQDGKGNKFKGDYFFTSDVVAVGAAAGDLQATIQRLTQPAPATDIGGLLDEEETAATGT